MGFLDTLVLEYWVKTGLKQIYGSRNSILMNVIKVFRSVHLCLGASVFSRMCFFSSSLPITHLCQMQN